MLEEQTALIAKHSLMRQEQKDAEGKPIREEKWLKIIQLVKCMMHIQVDSHPLVT